MGSKLKELVKEKELSNLYIDLSEEILKNLVFDSSPQDNQNQLLFLNCIENSISYFADDIYKSFESDIDSIEDLNFKFKRDGDMSKRINKRFKRAKDNYYIAKK